MDNALKAISSTDDELRVGNHIVLFGGRDLEGIASPRKNEDGSAGEYFTEETQIESRHTKAGRLPVDWEHGHAPEGDDVGVLGYVDWATARKTPDGVWVERVLQRHNSYVALLEQLIEAGVIGTSSEALSSEVEKAADGRIVRWPLVADTLTVSPMEPRMLSENALQAAKALGLVAEQPEPEAEAEDAVSVAEAGKATEVETEQSTNLEDEMGEEQENKMDVAAIVEGAVADALKAYREQREKEAPPLKSVGTVTEDELDAKARDPELPSYKHLGEQLLDIYKAGPMGRRPNPRLLKAHNSAAKAISGLSEQVPADGGFLVQEDFAGTLVKPDLMGAPLMSRARRIPLSGAANSTKLNGVSESDRGTGNRWGGVVGYWLAEADQITDSHPTFREIRLEPHKVAALVYATDEVLQDAAQLQAVVGQAAREELLWLTENAVVNGTGAGQPLGIMNAACTVSVGAEVGQAADTIVAENVIAMWARRYVRGSYVWMVSQDTFPQLIAMNLPVGTGGGLVYMPPGGLSGAPYGTIFGAPVIEIEYADNLGDTGDIILADMSQYLLCDKGTPQSAQSVHIRFDYDETAFRFIYRVDGQPAWHSEITPANDGDTISPFLYLAERS